ncbi:glutathione S-transferase family protein [Catenovulum sp. SM1970]|uniref:glutathione S-transferase family protein n=1 Tax=Marinifaba aquimaris TaxID=2741323 RepID=UPI00157473D6|nr:glutathione S-transferase family protein [Marinifaba aquimaris]NTS75393.1 glutathione S-transferase family protein [Marinifaba aquimaris]
MKLYGSYTSPYVRHCRIALIDTHTPFEFIETDAQASAQLSPTKRVPLLVDGDIQLTDSSSIVRYIREQAEQRFLPKVSDLEMFNLANTVMDTCANIFFINKYDGITPEQSAYLARQQSRVDSSLDALNQLSFNHQQPFHDGEIRLACVLAWGIFRERFSIDSRENLQNFLSQFEHYLPFTQTRPTSV